MLKINKDNRDYVVSWKTFRQHKYKKVFVPGVKEPIESKVVIPQKVTCTIESNYTDGPVDMVSAEVVCKKPDVFNHAKGRVESFAKAVSQLEDKKVREQLYQVVFAKYPGYFPEKHKPTPEEINKNYWKPMLEARKISAEDSEGFLDWITNYVGK